MENMTSDILYDLQKLWDEHENAIETSWVFESLKNKVSCGHYMELQSVDMDKMSQSGVMKNSNVVHEELLQRLIKTCRDYANEIDAQFTNIKIQLPDNMKKEF